MINVRDRRSYHSRLTASSITESPTLLNPKIFTPTYSQTYNLSVAKALVTSGLQTLSRLSSRLRALELDLFRVLPGLSMNQNGVYILLYRGSVIEPGVRASLSSSVGALTPGWHTAHMQFMRRKRRITHVLFGQLWQFFFSSF